MSDKNQSHPQNQMMQHPEIQLFTPRKLQKSKMLFNWESILKLIKQSLIDTYDEYEEKITEITESEKQQIRK